MKRKIGLLMAVLFALTLTSQTTLALNHDPFDPRYNGTVEKQLTTESDPWVDANNNGSTDRLFNDLSTFFVSIQDYFSLFWNYNYFKVQTIILNKQDSSLNNDNIPTNIENKNEKKNSDTNHPGTN